jgi:hypothetical protein
MVGNPSLTRIVEGLPVIRAESLEMMGMARSRVADYSTGESEGKSTALAAVVLLPWSSSLLFRARFLQTQ